MRDDMLQKVPVDNRSDVPPQDARCDPNEEVRIHSPVRYEAAVSIRVDV